MSIQRIFTGVFALACLLNYSGCNMTQKADLVVRNGTIYTMETAQPTAEAVAAKDGKITFVGSNEAVAEYVGSGTEILDLQGLTMTPGLIESHGHIMSTGFSKMILDLTKVKNYDELVAMVAEAVKKAKPGEWIQGRGWHQSKWRPQPQQMVRGFQTHYKLSAVSPNNPVYLRHASGHAGFANAKAMEIAGINSSSTFTDDGEIIKDGAGNPTGIFNERAQALISSKIPDATPEAQHRALKLASDECLANGITSFQDAGSSQQDIDLYHEMAASGELGIRLWVMLSGRDKDLLDAWYARGPEIGGSNNHVTVRAIKLYSDGALGSRGAWLLKPYSDMPGHSGHETQPMAEIGKIAQQGLQHGFQVCVHAIGDRANREVLDQFQIAFEGNPEAAKDHRFRIEHAQHISTQDIPRFAQLGVIASMQGIHMASDRPWAINRLGKDRIVEGAYVWQKLLKSGARVINGTDTPVEPVSPIASFYASVTRQTLQGTPESGYEADQKMTREQALRSYTLDAAYGGFEEGMKGSISVGKLADFTVLSQDILQVPDGQLLNTEVMYTIVGGKILYARDGESVSQR